MHSEIMDHETPRLLFGYNHSLTNVLDIGSFSYDEIYMWTLLHGKSLLTVYNLNKLKAFYSNTRYSCIYRVCSPFLMEVLL